MCVCMTDPQVPQTIPDSTKHKPLIYVRSESSLYHIFNVVDMFLYNSRETCVLRLNSVDCAPGLSACVPVVCLVFPCCGN